MTDYLRSVGFRVEIAMPYYGRRVRRAVEARVDRVHVCGTRLEYTLRSVQGVFSAFLSRPFVRMLERAVRKDKMTRRAKLVTGNLGSFILRKIDPDLVNLARRVMQSDPPAAVMGQFAWTARALDEAPTGTLKLLDTHDVQHLRRTRAQEAGGDLPGHACTREEEVRELSRADVLMAIQREEAEQVRELCPDKPIIVVEHTEGAHVELPSPAASKQVLFVGSLYDPNVQGMRRFIDGPWQEIRRAVPDAELVICGNVCDGLPDAPEGVTKKGRVSDLVPFYRDAAVVINPVPYGSGLKIKSVEALAYGKCLVATPSGVTGLEDDVDASFHVCEIAAMAGPIVSLLRDPDLRAAEEGKTRAYAGRRFAARNVYRDLERLLRRGLATKPENALTFATPSRRSSPARTASLPGGAEARSSRTAG